LYNDRICSERFNMITEEEMIDLMKERGLQDDRFLFGIYALNHVYRLLIDAGEINGDQAAELTSLIIGKVFNESESSSL